MSPPDSDPRRSERLRRLRERLSCERQALVRWMSRLRRAFRTVEKKQRAVARLEKLISQAEES